LAAATSALKSLRQLLLRVWADAWLAQCAAQWRYQPCHLCTTATGDKTL